MSFLIYGNNYWSPVYLSIIFSCLTSLVVFDLFKNQIGKDNAKYFTIFYSLGLYTLAWTSIVALRESLCALLTISFLKIIWELIERKKRFSIYDMSKLFIVLIILFNVRFYIPIFIIGSCIIYFSINEIKKLKKIQFKIIQKITIKKLLVLSLFLLAFLFLLDRVGGVPVSEFYMLAEVPKRFLSITFGPVPTKLSNEYVFLTFAAYFHMTVFPLSLLFILRFIKASDFNKFLFINLVFALFSLSLFGLNIRHRFQYEFIIYFIEFFMFYKLAENGRIKIRIW